MIKYFLRLKQDFAHKADWLNEYTGGWLWIITGATQEVLKPEADIIAAAIAYFALFSLFPITLLSVSIASFSFGALIEQQTIIHRIEFIAPAMGQLLGQNIDEIIKARGPVTGVALLGLLWSASTIFYMFTHTLNEIWGVKLRRSVWKRRGVSILFILTFVGPLLFLATILGSLASYFRVWLPAQIIVLEGGASLAMAILVNVIFFMALYTTLPHGDSTWREILPGAIGAGLLWEIAKKTFLHFVASYVTASNLVYGSVAAIIAFLVWAYVSGLIFLFGAYVSVAYFELKRDGLNKK